MARKHSKIQQYLTVNAVSSLRNGQVCEGFLYLMKDSSVRKVIKTVVERMLCQKFFLPTYHTFE